MPSSTDPRSPAYLTTRDQDVLYFIGRAGWASQPQVAFAVLYGLVKSIGSRIVRRLEDRGYVRIERTTRTAMNMLALTTEGRDLLVHAGRAHPDELFVPRRPLSPSMLRHTLWQNDVFAVLCHRKPARILPSWTLQRLLPDLAAIPDLLVVLERPEGRAAYIAIEVDLGTEGTPVLAAKLATLAGALPALTKNAGCFIHVLTIDEKRRSLIGGILAEEAVPSHCQVLPRLEGAPETLAALADLLGVRPR